MPMLPLEGGNRVDGRTSAADNGNRRHRQQEVPPLASGGCFAQRLEVAVVDQVNTEMDEREIVYRADER